MSAFIDASSIVAILGHEADERAQIDRLEAAGEPIYFSSIVVYEASFGLARKKGSPGRRLNASLVLEARVVVMAFLSSIGGVEVSISGRETELAVEASSAFGKVVGHPAKLNMGDCFAYACARANGSRLLYKGDDFTKTDIPSA